MRISMRKLKQYIFKKLQRKHAPVNNKDMNFLNLNKNKAFVIILRYGCTVADAITL